MKLAQIAQILFIAAASFAVYAFVHAAQNDHRYASCQAFCQLAPSYAGTNRKVPDFTLPDGEGNQVKLSSFMNGKPLVMNFWTKTCQPCLEEMPEIAEMAQILKEDGIHVITVCTDDGPEAVADTLQVLFGDEGPPFPVLYDPELAVVTDMFGTTLYPETWIIDGNGIIRARVDGNPKQTRGYGWSDPMPLEIIEQIGRPGSCPISFAKGKPFGPYADLCGDQNL